MVHEVRNDRGYPVPDVFEDISPFVLIRLEYLFPQEVAIQLLLHACHPIQLHGRINSLTNLLPGLIALQLLIPQRLPLILLDGMDTFQAKVLLGGVEETFVGGKEIVWTGF